MTTLVYKAQVFRSSSSGVARTLWLIRSAIRNTSFVTLQRALILASILFGVAYIGAAHMTLYEGGRFSDLQMEMRRQQLLQVEREASLTDLRSARGIRNQKDTSGLVDVSVIRYIEETSVVVDARTAEGAN